MKDFKSEIKNKLGNITENIKTTLTDKGLFEEKQDPVKKTETFKPEKIKPEKQFRFTEKKRIGSYKRKNEYSYNYTGSGFGGIHAGIESAISFVQKHYLYFAIGAAVAIAIPIITFASVGNAQVVIISSIETDNTEIAEVIQDDESDLFEGIIEDEPEEEILAAEGEETEQDISSVLDGMTSFIRYDSGMTADFIALIQQRLMDLDYMERDEPTTYYGPVTKQAIGYFQRKNGLEQDGVAGEETQRLLFSEEAKTYVVSEGDEGEDVSSIQERLKELGYNVSDTGYFGSDTTRAIAYFQRMTGISDDGCVGTLTREALYADNAETSIELKEQIAAEKAAKEAAAKKAKQKSKSKSASSSSRSGGKVSTTVIADPGSVESFIEVAESMAGVSYVKGGKSGSGVDCSGFVYVALKNSGNSIGYMTSGGWAGSGYPTVYSMSELQRGDIVCFNGHVGIYLGGGSMIDASSSQGCVRYCSNIQGSSYWTRNFICGKRPL